MIQTHARRTSKLSRVLVSILGLAAFGGWGLFAYSTHAAWKREEQLRGQITTIQSAQARFQAEQERIRASAESDLAQLQEQLSIARGEVSRLAEVNKKAQADLAETQAHLEAAQKLQEQRSSGIPKALIDVTPRPAKRDIVAAQKALTDLGYGKLKADGVIGSGTREAIEHYQRDAGLTVTGDLHAETLQKLLAPAGRLTAQSEE